MTMRNPIAQVPNSISGHVTIDVSEISVTPMPAPGNAGSLLSVSPELAACDVSGSSAISHRGKDRLQQRNGGGRGKRRRENDVPQRGRPLMKQPADQQGECADDAGVDDDGNGGGHSPPLSAPWRSFWRFDRAARRSTVRLRRRAARRRPAPTTRRRTCRPDAAAPTCARPAAPAPACRRSARRRARGARALSPRGHAAACERSSSWARPAAPPSRRGGGAPAAEQNVHDLPFAAGQDSVQGTGRFWRHSVISIAPYAKNNTS